ncbi:Sulfatase N-terminal [Trinorchestia longiramus]|nr:Sulfatase N-terminal [Trinorchestia longiramus]
MLHLRSVQVLTRLLATAALCVGLQGPQKPHLILIVADDLGWNDISWNNPGVVSPNLDRLANEGMILNRSYVQPICSPTRSALLASRYPFTIGRQGNVIWPLIPTGVTLNATLLPQELKKWGYDTYAVGKWHLGFCKWAYTPTFRGFDSFYGFYTGSEDYYTHMRGYSYYEDSQLASASGYDFRDNTAVNRNVSGNYSTFLFSDRVDLLLRARSPDTPLFLYMPFQSVHTPLQVPENYSNIYHNISNNNRRTYLGMVSALDEAVGRIVTSLKETGHYNNSIIVFTTDNGGPTITGANNWPLRGNKSTLWEGGTRGPAFIHSPMLTNPGTVSNRLIHVTDWYPTFVHLAGGTPPDDIDGVNQWETLNNKSLPDARDYFVYDINEANGMSAAIRWGRYKLIVGDPGPSSWTPPPDLQKSRTFTLRKPDEVTVRTDSKSEEIFSSSIESDETSKTNRENRNNNEELIKKEFDKAVLLDPSFNDRNLNSQSEEFRAIDYDYNFLGDESKQENSNGYIREVIDEDSKENSIFPDKNHDSKNWNSLFRKFPLMKNKLYRNSYAFIDMALKYFENNHIDVHQLLHPDKKDETWTVDDFINDQHTSDNEIDWLFNSANEQKDDKLLRRELKRRYRLASGASVRLTDFKTVQDFINSKVKMQLYDVEDDPTERLDLVEIQTPVVKLMLTRLLQEQPRYCPPDLPPDDSKGDPDNFDGAWSPGWC